MLTYNARSELFYAYKLIKSKFDLFTQERQNDCKIMIAISGLKDFAIALKLIFTRILCLVHADNSNLQFAR